MKIGYARVSTNDQHPELQIDALKAAGCEQIFIDRVSGAKADRIELNKALEYARAGDAFVVWKLDRAGRSLPNLIDLLEGLQKRGIDFISLTEAMDTSTPSGKLIFHIMGALAEFERAIIRERTNAGLAAARARGRKGGPRKKLTNGDLALAERMYADPANSIHDIYEHFGISRSTLFRYVGPKTMAERARKEQEAKAPREGIEEEV